MVKMNHLRKITADLPVAFKYALLASSFWLQVYASNVPSEFALLAVCPNGGALWAFVAVCWLSTGAVAASLAGMLFLRLDQQHASLEEVSQQAEADLNDFWFRALCYLYRAQHFLVTPLSFFVCCTGLFLGRVVAERDASFSGLPAVGLALAFPTLLSLALSAGYLFFIETYLPNKSVLSASHTLNSCAIPLDLGVALLLNSVAASQLARPGARTTVLLLASARNCLSAGVIWFNLTRVVFFNRTCWFVNSCFYLSIVHSLVQLVLQFAALRPALQQLAVLLLLLLAAFGVRVLRNLAHHKQLVFVSEEDLSLKDVLVLATQHQQILGLKTQQDRRFLRFAGEMMIYFDREADSGAEARIEQFRKEDETFTGGLGRQFVLHLFEVLQRGKAGRSFKASVLQLHLLLELGLNMYQLGLLLARLKGRARSFHEAYLLFSLQDVVQAKMRDVHSGNFAFTLQKKHRDEADLIDTSKAFLKNFVRVDFNHFLRAASLNQQLSSQLDFAVNRLRQLFQELGLNRPNLAAVHSLTRRILRQRSKCEELFQELDQVMWETPGAMTHILTYAIFIDQFFNEKERSLRLAKEFQASKHKETINSGKLSSVWEHSNNLVSFQHGVCLKLDGDTERLGLVMWVSKNFHHEFSSDPEAILGKQVETMLSSCFQDSHRSAALNLSKKWDKNYLCLPRERIVRLSADAANFHHVVVEVQLSYLIANGLTYLAMVRKFKKRESFLIIDMQQVVVGKSADLSANSFNPNYSPFVNKKVSVLAKKLEQSYLHFTYHELSKSNPTAADRFLGQLMQQNRKLVDVYREDWDTPPQDSIDIVIKSQLLPRTEPSHTVTVSFLV